MIPHRWRRAPADNGSADPNADVRPQRPANSILGAIRGLMASGAASRDDAIGELVASLGASNVYSVSTNEGLIDIATGINGVPKAITTPFLLRLAFDTALTGAVANVPHLVVDGYDCGPIVRRDGSALVDGDLLKGAPVLIQGDMALSTDTKVTRARVLDLTPSDIGSMLQGRFKATTFSGSTLTALNNNQPTNVVFSDASTPDFENDGANGIKVLTPGVYSITFLAAIGTNITAASTASILASVTQNGSVVIYRGQPYPAPSPGIYYQSVTASDIVLLEQNDILTFQAGSAAGQFGNSNVQSYSVRLTRIA